jgi:hypothetical protein
MDPSHPPTIGARPMQHDEDPAEIAAQLGLEIGTVKGRFRLSDLSPVSILSAVTMGEGFGRARLSGGAYLVLSYVCFCFSEAMLKQRGRVAFAIVPLVPIFAVSGLWLLVAGQPEAVPRPGRIRLWARLGLGACLGLGVLLGVVADALLVFG